MTDEIDMEDALSEDSAFGVFKAECAECGNYWYEKADMTVGESRTFECDECGNEWTLEYRGMTAEEREHEPLSMGDFEDVVNRFGS